MADPAVSKKDTISTRIPARLDRLPWSRFHWRVVIGLGAVWILDGLEVTLVGTIAGRLTEKGSGIALTAGDIGLAGSLYVVGACTGALFFGQLTDRFGRKRLFMITLGLYILATTATAFSFAPWYFFLVRFLTGAGIGGEYSSINSAIDELIPARVRGRVDLMINGSYWFGSAAGSAAALLFLDEGLLGKSVGWRLAFGLGAVLGLTIMLVRRNVPESPRWLFIHGRQDEAEQIVDQIERTTIESTGQQLSEPRREITVRQRETIPFREIARTAFGRYPRRAVLGFMLFVGQAFLYNGITFNLSLLFTKFYGVASGIVPVFVIVFAAGNLIGPLLLGRLFDTLGRKPMISATYFGSALIGLILAYLFWQHSLSKWPFEIFIVATFFLASAGASAAYLTVSEIFPMETRALAIAFFYAIGTGAGGIAGPLLFGHFIESGRRGEVAIAFVIGSVVMALGALAELAFGVRAEQRPLEEIAEPLTMESAESAGERGEHEGSEQPDTSEGRREALALRAAAGQERARAAEHRALGHELRASAIGAGADASDRVEVEERLADMADLRASALEERADAREQRESAQSAEGEQAAGAERRAGAAQARAEAFEEQARVLGADSEQESERYSELAQAARERATAREQAALAAQAKAEAQNVQEGPARELAESRAQVHEQWSAMHSHLASAHERRADGDRAGSEAQERQARVREELARAGQERTAAAREAASSRELAGEQERTQDAARAHSEREAEQRRRERIERRQLRERTGARRFRPGPGSGYFYSPGMLGSASALLVEDEDVEDLERELDAIARALEEAGPVSRQELARMVGARYWGPGRFRAALREALESGRARTVGRGSYAPPERAGALTTNGP